MPPVTQNETQSQRCLEVVNTLESGDSFHNYTTIIHSLPPFMILPATEPARTEAMSFFEYISIKDLNQHHPSEIWRQTLMLYSQTVPAVRHAAVALALVHRNYLDRGSDGGVHLPQFSVEAPLFHYNRAIQLLLGQEIGDATERTAITLLVCYLFVCFDHLAGNYVQATKHLRGGVELVRNIDSGRVAAGAGTLLDQVTRQIRRLDMQAVTFLVDWTPAGIQETLALAMSNGAFKSLDEAADRLQILVSQVMRLRHAIEQKLSPPPTSFHTGNLLGQLSTWLHLFENLLLQSCSASHLTFATNHNQRTCLLRLQHTITWILLSASTITRREMAYDAFLPQFRQCVALATEFAAAHERHSEQAAFTPEVGIIPVLYIVGVKCRDPTVRKQVLGMLRRQTIREAVWDSHVTARVVERIIQIEEVGVACQGMELIPAMQRVEDMSWMQSFSGDGVSRVNVCYRLCGREEVYIETLLV